MPDGNKTTNTLKTACEIIFSPLCKYNLIQKSLKFDLFSVADLDQGSVAIAIFFCTIHLIFCISNRFAPKTN